MSRKALRKKRTQADKDRKAVRGLDTKSTKRLSAPIYHLSLIVHQMQLKLFTSLSENFAALSEKGFRDK